MKLLTTAFSVVAVWALYALRAGDWCRMYPVAMAGIWLFAFAASLFRTPLVEMIARRTGAKLDVRGVAYCRRVTWVWTVFMALHFSATVLTMFMPMKAWALYNGAIAYILMGALFAGEWIYRRIAINGNDNV